ncbi:sigma-70 family RNA polymerase sigma factor [Limnoglobus roseus]|uniref:RNA polymerase subunit sigma n=1 Tax=Limnoglobus roseus TaxID=2598579 RepID=A0A5C1AEP2_9BACT|nr:sigma-70 family RNA polymerase sigma factor [Limnoglobus roseus]QEL16663.1 RNA polymerase subunit sigma [Limnoglobus roseus]
MTTDLTHILNAIDAGDARTAAELLPVVYEELRKLAAAYLANESAGQTLQPTALVHEAYLRLVGGANPETWNHRGHFFAAASVAIRRILVDNARRKHRQKRGGEFNRLGLDDVSPALPEPAEDLLALDEALSKLASVHPREAELVQLLYFGGLTLPEAAGSLGISPRTAGRLWSFSRAWLRREIEPTGDPGENL